MDRRIDMLGCPVPPYSLMGITARKPDSAWSGGVIRCAGLAAFFGHVVELLEGLAGKLGFELRVFGGGLIR